jgi:DNA-directed RNA polymerase subunit M/transcription elongation factor TFIIS
LRIQVVSKYLDLASQGLVSKMDCPLDQGLLMPNQDNNDNIYLYCLSCDYKKEIGLDLYGRMEKAVRTN